MSFKLQISLPLHSSFIYGILDLQLIAFKNCIFFLQFQSILMVSSVSLLNMFLYFGSFNNRYIILNMQ